MDDEAKVTVRHILNLSLQKTPARRFDARPSLITIGNDDVFRSDEKDQ
jgi:hypothetical protein